MVIPNLVGYGVGIAIPFFGGHGAETNPCLRYRECNIQTRNHDFFVHSGAPFCECLAEHQLIRCGH